MRKLYNLLPKKLQRLAALVAGKAEITNFNPTYHQDCLATNHWGAFVTDSKFQAAYQKAVGGWQLTQELNGVHTSHAGQPLMG